MTTECWERIFVYFSVELQTSYPSLLYYTKHQELSGDIYQELPGDIYRDFPGQKHR